MPFTQIQDHDLGVHDGQASRLHVCTRGQPSEQCHTSKKGHIGTADYCPFKPAVYAQLISPRRLAPPRRGRRGRCGCSRRPAVDAAAATADALPLVWPWRAWRRPPRGHIRPNSKAPVLFEPAVYAQQAPRPPTRHLASLSPGTQLCEATPLRIPTDRQQRALLPEELWTTAVIGAYQLAVLDFVVAFNTLGLAGSAESIFFHCCVEASEALRYVYAPLKV
eukprot:366398-Chlamydomonas_euryale.AAC.7